MTSADSGRTFGPIFTSSNIWQAKPLDRQRKHACHVGVRLLQCDARLESRDTLVAEVADEDFRRIETEGKQQLRIVVEESEPSGQNADDFPRPAVDLDVTAQNSGVAPELS